MTTNDEIAPVVHVDRIAGPGDLRREQVPIAHPVWDLERDEPYLPSPSFPDLRLTPFRAGDDESFVSINHESDTALDQLIRAGQAAQRPRAGQICLPTSRQVCLSACRIGNMRMLKASANKQLEEQRRCLFYLDQPPPRGSAHNRRHSAAPCQPCWWPPHSAKATSQGAPRGSLLPDVCHPASTLRPLGR